MATGRKPALTDDSEGHGLTALGVKAVVRSAVVVSRMFCRQREAVGPHSSRGRCCAPQGDVLIVKPVQDRGRASVGLTTELHHVTQHRLGPGGPEGEDRTRRWNCGRRKSVDVPTFSVSMDKANDLIYK